MGSRTCFRRVLLEVKSEAHMRKINEKSQRMQSTRNSFRDIFQKVEYLLSTNWSVLVSYGFNLSESYEKKEKIQSLK